MATIGESFLLGQSRVVKHITRTYRLAVLDDGLGSDQREGKQAREEHGATQGSHYNYIRRVPVVNQVPIGDGEVK